MRTTAPTVELTTGAVRWVRPAGRVVSNGVVVMTDGPATRLIGPETRRVVTVPFVMMAVGAGMDSGDGAAVGAATGSAVVSWLDGPDALPAPPLPLVPPPPDGRPDPAAGPVSAMASDARAPPA